MANASLNGCVNREPNRVTNSRLNGGSARDAGGDAGRRDGLDAMRLDELADAAFLSGGHADSPHASGFIGVPFASANALYGLSKLSVWWLRLGLCTRAHRQPRSGQPCHPCRRNNPSPM